MMMHLKFENGMGFNCFRQRGILSGVAVLVLVWVSIAGGQTGEAVPDPQEYATSRASLVQSIQSTLESEASNLEQIKENLRQFESFRKTLETELNMYRIQLSTYGNLLVLPNTDVHSLEKAYADNRAALNGIEERLNELVAKLDAAILMHRQTEEQQVLNEKHLLQIKADTTRDPIVSDLRKKITALTEVLTDKREKLDALIQGFSGSVQATKEIRNGLSGLSVKFEEVIRNKKKQALFERKEAPLSVTAWSKILQEMIGLGERIRQMKTEAFWIQEMAQILKEGASLMIAFFIILSAVIAFLLFRLRRFCLILMQRPICLEFPWRSLALRILSRSLMLFGMTLFFNIYMQIRQLDSVLFFQMLIKIFWVFVVAGWFQTALKLYNKQSKHPVPEEIMFSLIIFWILIRSFAVAYGILDWLMVGSGLLLVALRFSFELVLVFWWMSFQKKLVKAGDASYLAPRRFYPETRSLIVGSGYLIFGAGLLFELGGYGGLSLYWFTSWGLSLSVFLWGGLVFLVLREWNQHIHADGGEAKEERQEMARPIRWLVLRLCWLVWFVVICISFLLAWGGKEALLVNSARVLKYPLNIGEMKISLMGLLNAFLILFITQIVARLWRYMLQQKILVGSGIEKGLQESITTISLYILWFLGILMSLYAFGLSMASIAVAFGAIGIGLGFGLQNIFSNFISGIILLFERPIQVGDDVEINGIWATVRKINVRSTVVQTYDNASLIIPNSDFISTQVTNWSFKDKTVRRKVAVGVAYGSNIELVRRTLLEIADNTPKVFKYPKPDVLFTDFADSALIFKLRFWTYVDDMLTVETAVRFDIDRIFKEKKITIAFPQRDVHVYQMDKIDLSEGKTVKTAETDCLVPDDR